MIRRQPLPALETLTYVPFAPLTSHCAACRGQFLLSRLEMHRPGPDQVQLRCVAGAGCRKGAALPRVRLEETPDGRVRIDLVEILHNVVWRGGSKRRA